MFKWWKKSEKPKQKIKIVRTNVFEVGSEIQFMINHWTVTYTFSTIPTLNNFTSGELLRTILDPEYKDCWSGDVFPVKMLLKSGEINERNYP